MDLPLPSDLPPDAITTIIRRFEHLSTVAMHDVFGKMPYQWQLQIICHLSLMKTIDASICPGAVLLVRPTGGGKSSIRDVYSVMCAGVSLTITPLLSLGADQTQKIRQNTSINGGPVHAYHLDELRCPKAQKLLSDQLLSLSIDTDVTVFLFSSPQAIVNNQIWHPMINSLITKRLMSMLCIDEVHLFVQFGLTFCQEFALLQSVLFKQLRVKASPSAKLSRFHTTVPAPFMTATCNQSMVAQIEKLSGLRFDRSSNIFWPSADAMHHQKLCLRVAYSTHPLSSFKTLVGPALETSRLRKYIWYANNRNTIERHTEMLGSWINQQGFKSDIVSVTGAQMKEQKFHHINLFAATNLPNLPLFETSNDVTQPFNPQILTATSGAANAGLDSPDVYGVGRAEFPPTLVDVLQEKGRAGRRPNASAATDWYLFCLSLETYVYLLHGAADSATAEYDSHYKSELVAELQQTLEVLVLPARCLQLTLETISANPFTPADSIIADNRVPCGNSCSFCLGDYARIFPKVRHLGVQQVLLGIFVGQHRIEGRPTVDDALVTAIRLFPEVQSIVFGMDRSRKSPEPAMVKKLILMLLAARILETYVGQTEATLTTDHSNLIVLCQLAFDDTDETGCRLTL